jgi:membrane-associated phospholipid phosphatase
MLRFVWRTDLPDNTLPSQHTAFSILAFLIINRLVNKPIIGAWMIKLRKKIYTFHVSFSGGFFLIWAIFIILSTMFIKQHLFIDLIAGIIVSYLSYRIAFSKLIEKNLQRIKFLTKY